MKARVIATGEIVDENAMVSFNGDDFYLKELEIIQDTPDYWTRLEHQAAIAAMGGMCGNTSYDETTWEDMAEDAIRAAHALVEKLKEKEERK